MMSLSLGSIESYLGSFRLSFGSFEYDFMSSSSDKARLATINLHNRVIRLMRSVYEAVWLAAIRGIFVYDGFRIALR